MSRNVFYLWLALVAICFLLMLMLFVIDWRYGLAYVAIGAAEIVYFLISLPRHSQPRRLS